MECLVKFINSKRHFNTNECKVTHGITSCSVCSEIQGNNTLENSDKYLVVTVNKQYEVLLYCYACIKNGIWQVRKSFHTSLVILILEYGSQCC